MCFDIRTKTQIIHNGNTKSTFNENNKCVPGIQRKINQKIMTNYVFGRYTEKTVKIYI